MPEFIRLKRPTHNLQFFSAVGSAPGTQRRCALAQAAFQENRAIHYIPELDGLRGIAIILVVLFHSRPEPAAMFRPFTFLYTTLNIGSTGVDLFFVLSGFLITSILLSTKDATPRCYFWSFYSRRILRIFPLYILAVAGFFWISFPWLQSHGVALNASSSEQVWYWTYLTNWHDAAGHLIPGVAHFWSLAVEEQFYLIWPAVVFFCAVRYFPALCVGLGAFSFILRAILGIGHFMAPELLPEFIHRATITRLDTLALGALIAALVRNPDWTKRVRCQIKLIAPAAFGAFLLLWLAGQQGLSLPWNPGNTFDYLASAIAFGCVVFVCVTDQGSNHPLCRIARLRPLRSIGRYSYAIYVFHVFVINLVGALSASIIFPWFLRVRGETATPPVLVSIFMLGACLGTSYLVAFASWHLFEKHFLWLKKYFPYHVSLLSLPSTLEPETESVAEAAMAD